MDSMSYKLILICLAIHLSLYGYFHYNDEIGSWMISYRGFQKENVTIIKASNYTEADVQRHKKYKIYDITYETHDHEILYNVLQVISINVDNDPSSKIIERDEINKVGKVVEKYVNRNYKIITSYPLADNNSGTLKLYNDFNNFLKIMFILADSLLTIFSVIYVYENYNKNDNKKPNITNNNKKIN